MILVLGLLWCNISFAEENQSLFSLGKNASVIVTSNETQAFIDLIEDDREFILYELGKENFISQYFRSCLDLTEINGVKFYSLLKNSNNIAGFKDLYCKSDGGLLIISSRLYSSRLRQAFTMIKWR